MPFYKWKDIPKEDLPDVPGHTRRMVWGKNLMIILYEQEPIPGKKKIGPLPMHTHHHEQICIFLKGKHEFTIKENGKYVTKIMGPGDFLLVPPNVEHFGWPVDYEEKLEVIDIFSPIREDYIEGLDARGKKLKKQK